MKNRKEIKKLLERVNTMFYPIKYKFELVLGKWEEKESDHTNDENIIVRFHIDE